MPLYDVLVERQLTYRYRVEADSQEDAESRAKDMAYDGVDLDNPLNDHVDVEDSYEVSKEQG
jgi:hypothetical protein